MNTIRIAIVIAFFSFISCRSNENKSGSAVNATISFTGDNFKEKIEYSGVIRLDEKDSTIRSISPGGYVRLLRNNQRVVAEAGDSGRIVCHYFKDDKEVPFPTEGQQLLREAVRQMINNGFDNHRSSAVFFKHSNNG